MTELLVKWFVKDCDNTEDVKVRTSYGVLSSMVGICCNLLLFTAKLILGLVSQSISVMADAFNNLSDAASSIIGFVGVKMAQKPADEDHPFGHGRIEYISAFIVAFLVIQVGFSLFKTSVGKIQNPQDMVFSGSTVAVLALSIGVKLWLGFFNRCLGKRIQSTVMMATAADSLGDVAATSAAILSLAVFGVFGVNIDGIVGVAVSVAVMVAGVNIARDTLSPLIGQPIDPKVYREIKEFVEQYDGIVGTHDLIVHNYGPSKSMASIHAEVPSHEDIRVSHEIVDEIERDCLKKLGIFLVIHMDPVETHNQRITAIKDMVAQVLEGLDSRLEFHDLRVVDGTQRSNLIFDLVIPRDYNETMRDTLRTRIAEEMQKKDSRFRCIITMENSFCAENPESI
ncbi:MAG: cation transporter [Hungatella sp.]|jgi:cation diffusion facilitator family transporter|nr:cation transporter [Hungatella sp.]